MDVVVRGTVLGHRENRGNVTNKDTGEVEANKLKGYFVDLYDAASGAGELEAKPDQELPPLGAQITASVAVRAYSGFVRRGQAGDARVIYVLQAFRVDEPSTAAQNGRAKAGAKA